MKKISFLLFVLIFILFNINLSAETEPNDTCLTSTPISPLEGTSNHQLVTVEGATISKGFEEGTHKYDYDRDNFYFTPAVDGEINIKFQSSGNTNFFVGIPTCNGNIISSFSSHAQALFYAKAGERVNLLAMCRYRRNYKITIEFTPHSNSSETKSKISIKDVSISEGDSGILKDMVFTLVLDKPSSTLVGVDFKTVSSTAQASKDYKTKNARVVFMPGETEKEVKVSIIGDDEKESDEEFEVKLENPYNAEIAVKKAKGIIIDDDNGFVTPTYFDTEPNNDCSASELIPELDQISETVRFKAKAKVDPNQEEFGNEARDYFHFTPAADGNITIELSSNKAIWFTIGNKGCSSPWDDTSKWNIQRGTDTKVFKTFNIKAGKRIDISAVSYDPKTYDFKVIFTPKSSDESYKENTLEGFVKRMYIKALKRDAKADGLNFWVDELKNNKKTAQDMARYFFDSFEFKSQNLSNEEFLNRVYETIMNREPDNEGYNYWLNRLDKNDLSRVEIVDMFVDSPEFKNLAKLYGIKAN